MGDLGSIPGLGRSPGEGKGYPLQYSGLENSMDYIVHGVEKSHRQDWVTFTFLSLNWAEPTSFPPLSCYFCLRVSEQTPAVCPQGPSISCLRLGQKNRLIIFCKKAGDEGHRICSLDLTSSSFHLLAIWCWTIHLSWFLTVKWIW